MSRTYATPTKVQVQPGSDDVVCTGHKRKAIRLTAGPNSKNPGRVFFTCPLPRDDPEKCKFFQWEDQQPGTPLQTPAGPSAVTPNRTEKKRKLDDVSTPIVDSDNPFLSSSPQEEIHPLLSGAMRDLSAHLHRQDRLLVAADKMKDGLRKKVNELKEQNETLEARNRELEARNKELEKKIAGQGA